MFKAFVVGSYDLFGSVFLELEVAVVEDLFVDIESTLVEFLFTEESVLDGREWG